jgi:hypothetical protein
MGGGKGVELVRRKAVDPVSSRAAQVVMPDMEGTMVLGRNAPTMSSVMVFFGLVMGAPIMLGAASGISKVLTEGTTAVSEVITLIAVLLTLMFGGMIRLGMVLILVVSMMPKDA